MTVFSGWGPTDDGRVKPDLVAPGQEILVDLVSTGWVIPTGMAGGEYTASVRLDMHNGARATAEYSFTVE